MVIVEFDPQYVEDSKGNRTDISNGMTARVWVKYDKITYMKYWMEQIGLGKYFR